MRNTISFDQIEPGFYWVRRRHRDPFDPAGLNSFTIAEVSGRTPGKYQATILHQPRSLTVADALHQVDFVQRIDLPVAGTLAA